MILVHLTTVCFFTLYARFWTLPLCKVTFFQAYHYWVATLSRIHIDKNSREISNCLSCGWIFQESPWNSPRFSSELDVCSITAKRASKTGLEEIKGVHRYWKTKKRPGIKTFMNTSTVRGQRTHKSLLAALVHWGVPAIDRNTKKLLFGQQKHPKRDCLLGRRWTQDK